MLYTGIHVLQHAFGIPLKGLLRYRTGFRVNWGAGFTQEFQSLKHRNDTEPPIELARIGWGFGRAFANLYLHAQLAPGVRLQLTSYLSSNTLRASHIPKP